MSEDLIRRSDAIKALKREKSDWNNDYNAPIDHCIERLNKVKSADIPQGEWLLSDLQSQTDNDNGNYAYVCTNCNHTDIHAKTQKVPYCWWCGARMKGADDDC